MRPARRISARSGACWAVARCGTRNVAASRGSQISANPLKHQALNLAQFADLPLIMLKYIQLPKLDVASSILAARSRSVGERLGEDDQGAMD
jgi:hypothetical protein